ncbi:hypothetical protein CYMTET_35640 [Cymbomonas tetramitiformis]|uniref:Uncharacterized protein n=1 Tax=Cymbomonas tetramitiformis TaxID=36881 RepID=A0AAE0KNP2_9CHLO|nr:hypothetical protein CYMTET_35640 [Cymbomonas tetramitiformis]|eukprot:gene42-63_t
MRTSQEVDTATNTSAECAGEDESRMTSLATKRSRDAVVDDWRRLLFTRGFGTSQSKASKAPEAPVEKDATTIENTTESSRKRKQKTQPLWNNLQGIPAELMTDPPLINILKLIENSNLLRICGYDDRHDNRRGSEVIYQDVHDVIHTQTYTYESNLLTEIVEIRATNGVVVRTRPCVFGQRCQGLSPAIRGFEEHGGAILREYLNPKEYESFNTTGKHPEERRPCLLCMRSQIHFAYMCLLQSASRFPNPSILINSFVNPRNSVDGEASVGLETRLGECQIHRSVQATLATPRGRAHGFRDKAGFLLARNVQTSAAKAPSLETTSRDTTSRSRHPTTVSIAREAGDGNLVEDVVCALRAYFKFRAANVESLLSANSTDRHATQIKIAQFVQDFRHELPIRIVHMLHLLLDHHIVSELREGGAPSTRIVASETLTDIDRCVHKAVFLMNTNVAIRTTASSGEFRSVHTMMCHVISKCVPRACHMRSLTTVLDRYTRESRELRDILVDIVICGALGNFSDSEEHACLSSRRLLYASREIVGRIVKDRLAEKTDDMFILFSIREHVVATTNMSDAMSSLIRTFLPHWKNFDLLVSSAMNKCRAVSSKRLREELVNCESLSDETRYALLSTYLQQGGNHLKMTNRSMPRLPPPSLVFSVVSCSSHALFDSPVMDMHEAIRGAERLCRDSLLVKSVVDDRISTFVAEPRWLRAEVMRQTRALALDADKSEIFSTDAARGLWRTHTLPMLLLLKNKNTPGIVRLPSHLRQRQYDAVLERIATNRRSSGDKDLSAHCTLYVCAVCNEVKNIAEWDGSGLDTCTRDTRDDRMYCANGKNTMCELVPLIRLVLLSTLREDAFACAVNNTLYGVAPCCGEVRAIKLERLIGETPLPCASCQDRAAHFQHASTKIQDRSNRRSKRKATNEPASPDARLVKCAHCQKNLRDRTRKHTITLSSPLFPETGERYALCAAHYRSWMRHSVNDAGMLEMRTDELFDRINATAIHRRSTKDTYMARKNR